MAEITVATVVPNGIELALTAAAGGGDQFDNAGGNVFFVVFNGHSGAQIATFDSPAVDNFQVGPDASHDEVKSIPAGEYHVFGPFRVDQFNDGSDKVQVTYDAVTLMTVGAFKFQGKS